jgi:hypothetical protein
LLSGFSPVLYWLVLQNAEPTAPQAAEKLSA